VRWTRPENRITSTAREKRVPRNPIGPERIEKKLSSILIVRSDFILSRLAVQYLRASPQSSKRVSGSRIPCDGKTQKRFATRGGNPKWTAGKRKAR
jgi:hypothetical protein